MHHLGVLLPHTHGLLKHPTIVRTIPHRVSESQSRGHVLMCSHVDWLQVRMLPTVASLLPEAPRRQRETELRRERRLAQLQMVDLWRLLYK